MDKIISCCGLVCNECDAFIATAKNDDCAREEIAKKWAQMYGANIKASDINCRGCNTPDLPKIGHTNECEMRLCAIGKGFKTCAPCDDYPCKTLSALFEMVPTAKENLDGLRKCSCGCCK
jgi:hypothetical protein